MNTETEIGQPEPPFRQMERPPWWIFAGGVVFFVVLFLVIKAVLFGGDEQPSAAQEEGAAVAGASLDPAPGDAPPPTAGALDPGAQAPKTQAAAPEAPQVGQPAPPRYLALEERLDRLAQALEGIQNRLTALETAGLDRRIGTLETDRQQLEVRLQAVESGLKETRQQLAGRKTRRVAKARRVPAPRVKLVSVDNWGGRWQAVIEDRGLHILRTGSMIDGWTVAAIDPAGMTLARGKHQVTITP